MSVDFSPANQRGGHVICIPEAVARGRGAEGRPDTSPGPSQQVEKGAVAGLVRADLRLPAPAFSHLLMIGPSQGPVEATMLRLQ